MRPVAVNIAEKSGARFVGSRETRPLSGSVFLSLARSIGERIFCPPIVFNFPEPGRVAGFAAGGGEELERLIRRGSRALKFSISP